MDLQKCTVCAIIHKGRRFFHAGTEIFLCSDGCRKIYQKLYHVFIPALNVAVAERYHTATEEWCPECKAGARDITVNKPCENC